MNPLFDCANQTTSVDAIKLSALVKVDIPHDCPLTNSTLATICKTIFNLNCDLKNTFDENAFLIAAHVGGQGPIINDEIQVISTMRFADVFLILFFTLFIGVVLLSSHKQITFQ